VHKTFQRGVATVVLAGSASMAAARAFSEGFDDVAALGSAGWALVSNGTAAGDGWFQGNEAIFAAASGADNSYAAANVVSSSGSVSDWLMTPALSLPAGGSAD
jgi:hypothetical protein